MTPVDHAQTLPIASQQSEAAAPLSITMNPASPWGSEREKRKVRWTFRRAELERAVAAQQRRRFGEGTGHAVIGMDWSVSFLRDSASPRENYLVTQASPLGQDYHRLASERIPPASRSQRSEVVRQ